MQVRAGLSGPVDVELARPAQTMPGESAMPGGSVYELKWDGLRLAGVHGPDGVRLWSRNGTEMTSRFPEVTTTLAQQVPTGTVVDGEVISWNGDRLDSDLLQERLGTTAPRIPILAHRHPASFVAFDLLACDGRDLRGLPWTKRRNSLNALAAIGGHRLQLSPYTPKLAVARCWFTDYRSAGIDGVVVKGASTSYTPGKRGWVTVTRRKTASTSGSTGWTQRKR